LDLLNYEFLAYKAPWQNPLFLKSYLMQSFSLSLQSASGFIQPGQDEADLLSWFDVADPTRASSLGLHHDNEEVVAGYALANV
jgi:hypothetical protein